MDQTSLERPREQLFDEVPEGEAALWKYLSFAKLVLMLTRRTLHCTRVDRFEDRIEGRWPLADLDFFRDPRNGDTLRGLADARRNAVVSSWVERANESAAMWPLYGGGVESVAVVTCFDKLAACVKEKAADARGEEWCAGRVRYLDFARDQGVMSERRRPSPLKVFTLKHSSYEHENEVRALGVRLEGPMPKEGADIAIDPAAFVDRIVVNPRAGSWFFDLVAEAAAAHGLDGRVARSEITDLEEEAAQGER